MNLTRNSKYCVALALAALCGAPAFAQDAAKKDEKSASNQANDPAIMAAMMELAKPGENHKLLEATVGQWTYKVKYWVSPDTNMPPLESSGTTVTKSTMGGRYFISEHTGKMQMPGPDGAMTDMAFNGMALEGYDNGKKKYVSSWIDNMGTGIVQSEGTYDAAAKKLTYEGEYEPMPGMKTTMRQTITYADDNHHTMEYFEKRGGSFVKVMEINYTRSS